LEIDCAGRREDVLRRAASINAGAGAACSSHSVVFKSLPACPAKPFTVLLEALLDGVIAIRHLLSAKPRCITRAGLVLLGGAVSGFRSRIAASQNQCGNGYQNNFAHSLLPVLLPVWSAISVPRGHDGGSTGFVRPRRRPATKRGSFSALFALTKDFQAATASGFTSRLASWVSRASIRLSSSRLRCNIFCSSRRSNWPASAAAVPYAAIS